ncbi:MAG TPA: hypothetical protein VHF88_00095 [Thermoleophilaceae bacterium]|nr:hypothetical protein [Thermoleophilaceae bacterium]
MSKATSSIVVAVTLGLLAAAPAADAAKGVDYKGRTAGGHPISFRLHEGVARNFATGVPMNCIAIQGGGSPLTGVEAVSFSFVEVGIRDYKYSEQVKPSFHYNEVTRNHTMTLLRAGKRVIKGALRTQYSFLIPKYPIGTFSVYSCLGNTKFRARPTR